MPGTHFGVTAFPAAGVPYLARQTTLDKKIVWQAGDISRQLNVSLPRGVLVRGKVVELGSNAPVSGAAIQYEPEYSNNSNISDDIPTGWQTLQKSNALGEFQICVLPDAGRLLVHGPQWRYVSREFGAGELSTGKPGGQRNYAHAASERIPLRSDGADQVRRCWVDDLSSRVLKKESPIQCTSWTRIGGWEPR
jgi:hypothetical protein